MADGIVRAQRQARGASAVGVHGSTVYVAGGMTVLEAHAVNGIENSLVFVSSYNTETGTWSALPDLPEPRQHVGGAVVGSIFYVIGGRENGIEQYHNTTYALDLSNPTGWKTMAPMPTACGSLACSALGTKSFCFGGEGSPENWQKIFNETQAYDTTKDTWEDLEVMRCLGMVRELRLWETEFTFQVSVVRIADRHRLC